MRGVVTLGGNTEPPLVPEPPAPAVTSPVLLAFAVVVLAAAPPVLVVLDVSVVLFTAGPSVLLELVPPVLLAMPVELGPAADVAAEALAIVLAPDVDEPVVALELVLVFVPVEVSELAVRSDPEQASTHAHARAALAPHTKRRGLSVHERVGFNVSSAPPMFDRRAQAV